MGKGGEQNTREDKREWTLEGGTMGGKPVVLGWSEATLGSDACPPLYYSVVVVPKPELERVKQEASVAIKAAQDSRVALEGCEAKLREWLEGKLRAVLSEREEG